MSIKSVDTSNLPNIPAREGAIAEHEAYLTAHCHMMGFLLNRFMARQSDEGIEAYKRDIDDFIDLGDKINRNLQGHAHSTVEEHSYQMVRAANMLKDNFNSFLNAQKHPENE